MATKTQNEQFSKYMKEHPNRYPDSISSGGHRGVGTADRERGKGINPGPINNSRFNVGIIGGILAHRLGWALPKEYEGFL